MRRCFTLALAAAAAFGCTDGSTPTGIGAVRGKEGDGRGTMAVSVVSFRPFPESTYVSVRGAMVVVSFVDTIPSDTTGAPPESLMVAGMPLNLLVPRVSLLDSIPVDTLPPDTIPTDTIPPDTNPPPPPPPPGCGRTGVVVARGRTDERGALQVSRLRPGKYDVKVVPPDRSGLRTGLYCGAIVFDDRTSPVQVTLFPAPPDSSGGH
ncbi:MAG: hypothetical protein ABI587_01070 [Gemmatimonadales bacterium]